MSTIITNNRLQDCLVLNVQVLETASLPETRGSVPDVSSSEASHAGVSERAGTPAASCRKRNSEDLYSPRQKVRHKAGLAPAIQLVRSPGTLRGVGPT